MKVKKNNNIEIEVGIGGTKAKVKGKTGDLISVAMAGLGVTTIGAGIKLVYNKFMSLIKRKELKEKEESEIRIYQAQRQADAELYRQKREADAMKYASDRHADAVYEERKKEAASEHYERRAEADIKVNESKNKSQKEDSCVLDDIIPEQISKTSSSTWIQWFHDTFPMPKDLHPFLKQFISCCPEGFKDATLFHILAMLGALCFSKAKAKFADHRYHRPNLMVIVEGLTGEGKGWFKDLFDIFYEKYIDNDKEGIKYYLGSNTSRSEFFDLMYKNGTQHVFMFESEIKTVTSSFKKSNGLDYDYFRKAFDNDYITRNNASKSQIQGQAVICMNATFLGTPSDIENFMLKGDGEIEGGSAGRFCWTVIEKTNDGGDFLKNFSKETILNIQKQIDEWKDKNMELVGENGLVDLGDNLQYLYRPLDKWVEEQICIARENNAPTRGQIARRMSAMAFHAGIVLHLINGLTPDDKQKDEITTLTLYIANYFMERYLKKFAKIQDEKIRSAKEAEMTNPSQKESTWPKMTASEVPNEIGEEWLNLTKNGTMSLQEIANLYSRKLQRKIDKNTVNNYCKRHRNQ